MRTGTIEYGSAAHQVLKLIYERGVVSQMDVARELAITKAACNLHFLRLKEENIITPEVLPASGRGCPSSSWRINAAGNYFMGIYLYYNELAVSVADFDGKMLFNCKYHVSAGITGRELAAQLVAAAGEGCRWIAEHDGVLHQTFFCAGGVITQDGVFESLASAPGVTAFAPEEILRKDPGISCYADTLHHAYVQRECRSFPEDSTVLMLNWGSTFGGTPVNKCQLLVAGSLDCRRNRGIWNIGHISVNKDGPECYCGKHGCLEQYVGGNAISARHPAIGKTDMDALLALLEKGDAVAISLLQEAAKQTASALYWLIELLGIDTIHFTGSFAPFFKYYQAAFREELCKMYSEEAAALFTICASESPENVLGEGAALMARHFFFYPEAAKACRGAYRSTLLHRQTAFRRGETES